MPVSPFRAVSGRRAMTGRQRVSGGGGGGSESVGGGGAPATNTVNVSSIAALKTAALDNTVDVIILADGTYSCANSTSELTTSLFFGGSYASRTRPLTIRSQTTGGVTFDGGGSTCGIFVGVGAHGITFDGFRFANWFPDHSGVIVVGTRPGMVDPASYNITFKNITIENTCVGGNTPGNFTDHAIYVASSIGGHHGLLFEDITVNAPADTTRLLHSCLHVYGNEDSSQTTAWGSTVRRLSGRSKDGAIIWGNNIHDWLFDTMTFTNCSRFGVRQQYANTGMEYRACTSTGSGVQGFYNGLSVGADNVPRTGTTFTNGTSFA